MLFRPGSTLCDVTMSARRVVEAGSGLFRDWQGGMADVLIVLLWRPEHLAWRTNGEGGSVSRKTDDGDDRKGLLVMWLAGSSMRNNTQVKLVVRTLGSGTVV